MRRIAVAGLGLAVSLAAVPASADRVHLAGGAVIEGKATRQGDKVVVELSGGEIALDAASVERIERSESDVERFERRYAGLAKGDVAARIALADFCRDRGLRDREQGLLREVIELSPDHAEARARLGFVRDKGSWISRAEQAQAQGLVEFEGSFITREQQLQIERLRAETAQAVHAREQAALELEAKRIELEAKQREAASAEPDQPAAAAGTTTIVVGGYPFPHPHPPLPPPHHPPHFRHHHSNTPSCGAPPCPEQRPRQSRFVPYIRDPSEYF